jgi:hypothetical protein
MRPYCLNGAGYAVTSHLCPLASHYPAPFGQARDADENEGWSASWRLISWPAPYGHGAPFWRRARAFRRSTDLNQRLGPAYLAALVGRLATSPPGSRPFFLGRGLVGYYPSAPIPVQRSTSQTGHNAGRFDARSRPGARLRASRAGAAPPAHRGKTRLVSRPVWRAFAGFSDPRSRLAVAPHLAASCRRRPSYGARCEEYSPGRNLCQ